MTISLPRRLVLISACVAASISFAGCGTGGADALPPGTTFTPTNSGTPTEVKTEAPKKPGRNQVAPGPETIPG